MSKRNSGHKKRKGDLYETPAWVLTDCLAPFFPVKDLKVGEYSCGPGKLVRALVDAGAWVLAGDISRAGLKLPVHVPFTRGDFRKREIEGIDALVMNPPYGEGGALAVQFIEHGLAWLRRWDAEHGSGREEEAFMALLLPVDFDLAVTRIHLFERCPEYHGCIRLRRRIVWFKPKKRAGKKANGPSQNHAWFIWRSGARPDEFPVTMWAPSTGALL